MLDRGYLSVEGIDHIALPDGVRVEKPFYVKLDSRVGGRNTAPVLMVEVAWFTDDGGINLWAGPHRDVRVFFKAGMPQEV